MSACHCDVVTFIRLFAERIIHVWNCLSRFVDYSINLQPDKNNYM